MTARLAVPQSPGVAREWNPTLISRVSHLLCEWPQT